MRKFTASVTLLLLLLISSARVSANTADKNSWIRFGNEGDFKVLGCVKGGVSHFGKGWELKAQQKNTVTVEASENGNVKGKFAVSNSGLFVINQQVEIISPEKLSYKCSLESEVPVETKQLSLCLDLPVTEFAGKVIYIGEKKITLPEEFDKATILGYAKTDMIILHLAEKKLILSGKLQVMVQDNRKYNTKSFSIRIYFTPSSGKITKSGISLDIGISDYNNKPLDLHASANMGFADETEGDGKEVWTDQWSANDLRMLTPGTVRYAGISFDIIDPKINNNKAAIVLSAKKEMKFPQRASVIVGGEKYNYLYFLHAAAWGKGEESYGKVKILYKDGSESSFDVIGKRDLADWRKSCTVANGAVVWTADNADSYVGLYMSKFPVESKEIDRIVLSGTDKAVWMVVGITGSVDDVELPIDNSVYYIVEGKDWKKFSHSLDVKKGSALDLSFLSDAPAGKHGRVIVNKTGKFAFENKPQKPVRFYGTNLCFSANYLDKKQCEILAERLVRYGYNSVRLHHHDGLLVKRNKDNSLTINKDQIDKLDYLLFCLKNRGIYVTSDIFVSRYLLPGETEIFDKPSWKIKALAPFSEPVMANVKAFAALWLNHVNPYTGLAWKNDPALFSLSFINENTLYWIWAKEPAIKQIYLNKFQEWATQNNIPVSTEKDKGSAFLQFITDMQIHSYETMKAFVKDELGCKALYTDANMCGFVAQVVARNRFDYVDNHGYWDHPSFPNKGWKFPFAFHNMSSLPGYCSMPTGAAASRIFGKPFTVTEFNYTFPNQYRSEGNAVMGAYASFQGWDAMYRFAFSHRLTRATTVTETAHFDTATDPLTLLGERIVSLLFLRGDVAEGKGAVPYILTPDIAQTVGDTDGHGKGFDSFYRRLGLIYKTGGVVLKKDTKLPADTLFTVGDEEFSQKKLEGRPYFKDGAGLDEKISKAKLINPQLADFSTGVIHSDTGQITLIPIQRKFIVVTPRSECLVIAKGADAKGKVLAATEVDSFCTIFASAIDDKPLAASSRILLLHLTDIKNTRTKFLNSRHSLLADNGTLPHLVRQGKAEITLNLQAGNIPQVWSLDMRGNRIARVTAQFQNNVLIFTADTGCAGNSTMAYEIIR